MRAVYLLATALAASPVSAQQAPVTSVTVALNLPVGRPMILTISDRRMLTSGTMITFTITHQLRFTATDAGWEATVAQLSLDCAGPANACRAYRAMMRGGNRIERHFTIARDGGVAMAQGEQDAGLGTAGPVGANAAMIVEQAEQSNPGVLRAGELREALQFAGQRFDLEEVWASQTRGIGARRTSEGMVEILQEQLIDGTSAAGVARSSAFVVDPATGLMLSSSSETRTCPATDAPPISVRTWRLEPASEPAR